MSIKTCILVLIFLSLLPITWNWPISISNFAPGGFPPAPTLLARAGSGKPPCMEEQYRSLWDILMACGQTVFACSWNAVHMNIPARKIGHIRRYLQRFWVMFYATLVPEAILVWALRQRVAAKVLTKKYNQALGGLEGDNKERQRWTITHGFYVQMGGFMLYDRNEPVCVLTCDNLINLMISQDIEPPNISEEEIEDKSKSGMFLKLVAIGQVAYFVGKAAVYRLWHLRLPITNLELGVIWLCFLDFVIYALWFKKPLDVEVPTPVRLVRRQPPDQKAGPSGSLYEDLKRLSDSETFGKLIAELEKEAQGSSSDYGWKDIRKDWTNCREGWLQRVKLFIVLPYHLWILLFRPVLKLAADDEKKRSGRLQVPMFAAAKSGMDVKEDIVLFALVVLFAGGIFSGGHLFAWNWYFPTTAERSLWRAMGIISTAAPFLTGVIVFASQMMAGDQMTAEEEKVEPSGTLKVFLRHLWGIFVFLSKIFVNLVGISTVKYVLAFAYFLGRVILVVLMLTTLRNLPVPIYREY